MEEKNLKMTLEFCGTAYYGYQIQDNKVTIEGTIKKAWEKAVGQGDKIIGCSRTDAGVHANEYVINVLTDTIIPIDRIMYVMNLNLPEDIVIKELSEVSSTFHARYDAVSKEYMYRIYNGRLRNPFIKDYAWHVPYNMSLYMMEKAAMELVGTHDFLSFTSEKYASKETVKTIYDIRIEEAENDMINIYIEGDGFLYHMVRIIVGTLVNMGLGKIDYESMSSIIESKDRNNAGKTAPSKGLYLNHVFYPKH